MEAGFRKLWSRKKSWGAADQPTGARKVSTSNSVLSQSTASVGRDGRPSMASTRPQPSLNAGLDTSGGVKSVNNTDELTRTKSGHRIQPMLVGISRPPTGNDRPDTAGSLQLAVEKAADSVNHRPSEVSAAPPMLVKQHLNTKPSIRHVDIFSVAAATPAYLTRYNEEIAERNLDTYRLVLENTPYVYDPSSKYQEEVAIRNAYLPYRSRASTDTRRSQDHDRTASLTNQSVRGGTTSQPNGVPSHHSSAVSADLNPKVLPEQRSHSRQSNPRSQDGTHIPLAPQAPPDQPENVRGTLKIITQVSGPQSPQRNSGQLSQLRENRMSTIAEGQPYEARPSTDKGSRRYHAHSSSRTSDYNIVDSEYRVTNTRSTLNDRAHDLGLAGENSLVLPHSRGTAFSSKRTIVLPNRTIMDLTGDDGEMVSETSSAFGYSQYSPVIEQAKSDAFRRIQPSQIHTEERRGSKGPSQLQTPTDILHFQQGRDPEPVFDETMLQEPPTPRWNQTQSDRKPEVNFGVSAVIMPKPDLRPEPKPEPAHAPAPKTQPKFEPKPEPKVEIKVESISEIVRSNPPELTEIHPAFKTPSPSTFSPISTMLSWSPRSSAYIANPSEPISMTARVQAALEASRAISKEASTPASSKRGAEAPTVRERVASYESTTERSISPQTASPESSVSTAQTTTPLVSATPARPTRQALPSETTKISTTFPTTKAAPVLTSPEVVTSVEYTDPGSPFGVRTRDFALVPQKSAPTPQRERNIRSPQPTLLVTKNVEQKPKSAGKARSKRVTPAVQKPKEPGFDEDAFARKQAEARAALEKLQKSLNEDFLTLPDRGSVRNSKGKEPERAYNQPLAPAIVPPQDPKAAGLTGVSQKPDAERPPPSSYRNSRGEQQRSSLISNRSLSASSKSSRRAPAPSTLKNVEPATRPIDQNAISPALLHAVHLTSKAPRSPGEISLSSFPVPSSSRPPSQPDVPVGYHSHTNSYASAVRRRNSQSSTTSAFSIPLHMVPGRSSSVRDPLPEEGDPL